MLPWWEYRKVSPFDWVGGSFWYDIMLGDALFVPDEEVRYEMLREYYPDRYWNLHGNGD